VRWREEKARGKLIHSSFFLTDLEIGELIKGKPVGQVLKKVKREYVEELRRICKQ
jgi:hypothetical protein